MKSIGERKIVSGAGLGSRIGDAVIVGVKLDAESKELLTWALMKVARPGDIVIALHVFDSFSDFDRGTGNLLSLIQTLDSLLSAYEGFCKLKQVDLKLKLCRGSKARKIIVREAKANSVTKVVVGTSSAHRSILSWNSVAKYCARKLPKDVAIFSVRNGKPQFQRETFVEVHPSHERPLCARHTSKTLLSAPPKQVEQKINMDNHRQDSLSFTTLQKYKVGSASGFFNESQSKGRNAWSLLRHTLLRRSRNLRHVNSHRLVLMNSEEKYRVPCLNDNYRLRTRNDPLTPIAPSVVWISTPRDHRSDDPCEILGTMGQKYTSCRIFTYEDLVQATSNFMPENLVGQGGSSNVYKGRLADGKEVAVKASRPSKDALKEYLVEVDIITILHHKNINSLLGFGVEHDRLLLIYDFLSRGSVEENLHGKKMDFDLFNWEQRFKVAFGVAEALNYLHFGRDQPVLHMDVKSSNILLSDDFEPRLSDFGFSVQVSDLALASSCSDVTGTFGYMAPEFFMNGKISDKVDVFAYGVVLLELLSGRKAINKNKSKQESLVMWAKPILESGKTSELIDPRVGGIYDEFKIERMFLASKFCLRHSAKHRPPISLVMRLLQGDDEIMQCAREQTREFSCDGQYDNKLRSHLSLALQDVDDDSLSFSSSQLSIPLDEYLSSRCTRRSSPETSPLYGSA